MKILKKILLAVAILIIVLLIAALFIDKNYTVEREVTINKPKQEVFEYVKLLKNQDTYNKWVMMDPTVRREYQGTNGTVGFIAAWDSDNKNVGKGEQEIKNISEGEKIDCEVRFKKPFEGTAFTHMLTKPLSSSQTKVRWSMEGKNTYPMNLMNIFIPGMLGKDLQASLGNLKSVLEK